MTIKSKLLTSAGLLVLSAGFALAAPAIVQSPVNLRAGPGIGFEVITAMPAGAPIDVMGCGPAWCRVAFGRTVGFASREFLALGGPNGPGGPGYATFGEGYGNDGGYVRSDTYSYGTSPGYAGGYGNTGFGTDVRTSERVRGEGIRGEGVRRGGIRSESRGARVGTRANVSANGSRTTNTQTRMELKGNNPIKDYGTTHNPNLRAEGQATPLKGNNPMRVRASTSNPNLRNAEAPAAIKGNNPMKMPERSTATNERSRRPSETTGAGSSGERRY